MIISCVTGNLFTFFIMEQINLTCLISFSRINICYNTIGSELHAFNGIRHQIFGNCVKLMKFTIFTDYDLLQSIRNFNSICNFILNAFTVGGCV